MKKTKLKRLLQKLTTVEDRNSEVFADFDKEVATLKSKLEEKLTINTLQEVTSTLSKMKKDLDLSPLTDAVGAIHEELLDTVSEIIDEINNLSENKDTLEESFNTQIQSLKDTLTDHANDIKSIPEREKALRKEIQDMIGLLDQGLAEVNDLQEKSGQRYENSLKMSSEATEVKRKELEDKLQELDNELERLRIDIFSRLEKISSDHGGNANRQVLFNSLNELDRYTDYNLIAGSNVTITSVDNHTLKRVDVTIASSGGGGGGGTTVETPTGSVNSVNVSFTVTAEPLWVVADGITYFAGAGYTYSSLTITMDVPPSQYIRAVVASSVTVETPTGSVNSSNVTFTVTSEPKWVVSDGITYFNGAGYSYAALSITMDIPPSQYIRSIY